MSKNYSRFANFAHNDGNTIKSSNKKKEYKKQEYNSERATLISKIPDFGKIKEGMEKIDPDITLKEIKDRFENKELSYLEDFDKSPPFLKLLIGHQNHINLYNKLDELKDEEIQVDESERNGLTVQLYFDYHTEKELPLWTYTPDLNTLELYSLYILLTLQSKKVFHSSKDSWLSDTYLFNDKIEEFAKFIRDVCLSLELKPVSGFGKYCFITSLMHSIKEGIIAEHPKKVEKYLTSFLYGKEDCPELFIEFFKEGLHKEMKASEKDKPITYHFIAGQDQEEENVELEGKNFEAKVPNLIMFMSMIKKFHLVLKSDPNGGTYLQNAQGKVENIESLNSNFKQGRSYNMYNQLLLASFYLHSMKVDNGIRFDKGTAEEKSRFEYVIFPPSGRRALQDGVYVQSIDSFLKMQSVFGFVIGKESECFDLFASKFFKKKLSAEGLEQFYKK